MNKGTCISCGKKNVEICSGEHCRGCHVDVSWKDCIDGTFDARLKIQRGVPVDQVKADHPDARIGNDDA